MKKSRYTDRFRALDDHYEKTQPIQLRRAREKATAVATVTAALNTSRRSHLSASDLLDDFIYFSRLFTIPTSTQLATVSDQPPLTGQCHTSAS